MTWLILAESFLSWIKISFGMYVQTFTYFNYIWFLPYLYCITLVFFITGLVDFSYHFARRTRFFCWNFGVWLPFIKMVSRVPRMAQQLKNYVHIQCVILFFSCHSLSTKCSTISATHNKKRGVMKKIHW